MQRSPWLLAAILAGVLMVPTAASGHPPSSVAESTKVSPMSRVYIGLYEIRNAYINRCMDAHANGGGLNGNPVGLFDCNGGVTEKWQVWQETSRADYQYQIINAGSGRCLDYPASSGGANGWQYVLWDCVQSTGQWFRFSAYNRPIGGRLISVQLGGPHNHVDAFQNGGGGNGNPIGNWVWTGHPLQHWRFVQVV